MKVNSYVALLYLILIPFFFPRGFIEYFQGYKLFYTIWIYASTLLIVLILVKLIKKKQYSFRLHLKWMIFYFFFLIIDTLIVQNGINDGIQKMFVAPVLCIGCSLFLERKYNSFFECISNILILFMGLNLIVFNPAFFPEYFHPSGKILFLGHVQVCSQIGMLGLVVSTIIKDIDEKNKMKSLVLLLLSIATMIMSRTVLSAICLLVLIFGVAVRKIKCTKKLFFNYSFYLLLYLVTNLIMFVFLSRNNWNFLKIGISSTLHGRLAIWQQIFNMLNEHWIFGYGTYGYRIIVYWNQVLDNDGMIYAHNQLLQVLLDGGVILLVLFVFMLYGFVHSVNVKTIDKNTRNIITLVIISFFIVMIIESPFEYFYFYVVLSMLPYVHKSSNANKKILINR